MTHILGNSHPLRADESNLLIWKRNHPRHWWCLEKLLDSHNSGHIELAQQLFESIRESGRLGEETMMMLWNTATEIEKNLRDIANEKSPCPF